MKSTGSPFFHFKVVTFSGTHTFTGTATFSSAITYYNATHTGGLSYTVDILGSLIINEGSVEASPATVVVVDNTTGLFVAWTPTNLGPLDEFSADYMGSGKLGIAIDGSAAGMPIIDVSIGVLYDFVFVRRKDYEVVAVSFPTGAQFGRIQVDLVE